MNNRAAAAVMAVFLLIAVLFGNPGPAAGSPADVAVVASEG